MPLTIIGDLAANDVAISEAFIAGTQHGRLMLNGTRIRVSIRSERPGHYFDADLDSGSTLDLAANSFVNVLEAHLRRGSSAAIGENSFAIGKLKLYSHERAMIRIGRDCLIGDGALCMISDMHSVVDVASGPRINPPGDIRVGDKVWIGAEAIILKGTSIGNGSIIAIRSVVMGAVPDNAMMLGHDVGP
jgi:acetyltransferase-like isoleucine patch superfamily enzyme